MNPTFKSIGTHLLVMLAFVGLAFLYASPLLEGKTLRMEDMTQVEGMSRELKAYKHYGAPEHEQGAVNQRGV